MGYQHEKSDTHIWPDMQSEHDLLEHAIKSDSRRGSASLLNYRIADHERKIALYFVNGYGMGHGHSFALVHAGEILWLDVHTPENGPPCIEIARVEMPERLAGRREELLARIVDALNAYHHLVPYHFMIASTSLASANKVAWRIIPRRFSKLFWKTEIAAWLARQKPKADRVAAVLKSPMLAFLGLFGGVLFAIAKGYSPAWPLIIGGAWVWYHTDGYDEDYYFLPWMAGTLKSKNVMATIADTMQRSFAVPLDRLTVQIQADPASSGTCTLRLKNTTAFFVPHVSFTAMSVANLVAPGFADSLRDADGRLSSNQVDTLYELPARRWLLPFQSVAWMVPLQPGFPMTATRGTVEAVVTISQRVSGRRKPGAQVYALPVIRAVA